MKHNSSSAFPELFGKPLNDLKPLTDPSQDGSVDTTKLFVLPATVDGAIFDDTDTLERKMLEAIIASSHTYPDGRVANHTLEYVEFQLLAETSRNLYAQMVSKTNAFMRSVYDAALESAGIEKKFFEIQQEIQPDAPHYDEEYFNEVLRVTPPLTYDVFCDVILRPNNLAMVTGWKGVLLSGYIDEVMATLFDMCEQGRNKLVQQEKIVYMHYQTRQEQKIIPDPEGDTLSDRKSVVMIHPRYLQNTSSANELWYLEHLLQFALGESPDVAGVLKDHPHYDGLLDREKLVLDFLAARSTHDEAYQQQMVHVKNHALLQLEEGVSALSIKLRFMVQTGHNLNAVHIPVLHIEHILSQFERVAPVEYLSLLQRLRKDELFVNSVATLAEQNEPCVEGLYKRIVGGIQK